MQKTTVFGIKATFASILLNFLLTLLLGFVLGPFMHNLFFAGTFSVVLAYVSTYIATRTLLKNEKLVPADRSVALDRTWQISVGVGLLFFLVGLSSALERGGVWIVFSLMTIIAGFLAIKVLARKS